MRIEMQSSLLRRVVASLAIAELSAIPPSFAEVIAQVEAIPGVRFAEMFQRLAGPDADGDVTIAAIWQLVAEEQKRQAQQRAEQQA